MPNINLLLNPFVLEKHNSYFSQYISLCLHNSKTNPSDVTEEHHIHPTCLQPKKKPLNKVYNLVNLSYENHCLAHELLSRAFPIHKGLDFAASIMNKRKPRKGTKHDEETLSHLKERHNLRNSMSSEEWIEYKKLEKIIAKEEKTKRKDDIEKQRKRNKKIIAWRNKMEKQRIFELEEIKLHFNKELEDIIERKRKEVEEIKRQSMIEEFTLNVINKTKKNIIKNNIWFAAPVLTDSYNETFNLKVHLQKYNQRKSLSA